MKLHWHKYKYFPYEKELALRELRSLVGIEPSDINGNSITIESGISTDILKRLVYFSYIEDGSDIIQTFQKQLEAANEGLKTTKRQVTRYSSHGLHEYKGKFNPQVVRAILNIFCPQKDAKVFDPFCGSGTTLIEAHHSRQLSIGFDINPLAVFISNAKLKSLVADIAELRLISEEILKRYKESEIGEETSRSTYLKSWFPLYIYETIEKLRITTNQVAGPLADIFLVIISNNLRNYSFQEPGDLRIRRRSSPFPEEPFIEVIKRSFDKYLIELQCVNEFVGRHNDQSKAILFDIRKNEGIEAYKEEFDIAVTSPPYATALPYIDTQRLSLVWLGLIEAGQVTLLEEALIGSREFRKAAFDSWRSKMQINEASLPENISKFCNYLEDTLAITDGFRRRAVPSLLYRYFSDMKKAFENIAYVMKEKSFFALVVGHNQTTIGGVKHRIDTPTLLSHIAEQVGWKVTEITKLQTYQRYGLHNANAINEESLIVLKKV